MNWKNLPKKKRLYALVFFALGGILAWAFITAGIITHDFNRQQLKSQGDQQEAIVRGIILTETKDEQKNTETTKDDQKNTETTKDDNKKDELEIITNTTKTDNTTEKTTQDTTVSQEKELPKTGATTVALIVLAVVAIGTISLIRYKNIEIK